MTGRLLRRWRGSYGSYVLLFFFSYFAMSCFTSVLSVYLTGIGKTKAEMSLIVSASGIFSIFMAPLTGYLCDRFRRSRLISILLLSGMGVLALLFPLTDRVALLFLLDGLIMSFYSATMPISERLAGEGRHRYGVLRIWGTVGYAAGTQAAGLAVRYFQPWVLFALVCAAALLAILGYTGAAEDSTARRDRQPAGRQRAPLRSFLRTPAFLLFLVISFLFYACSGTNMTYAPLLLRERFSLPTDAVGTVLSVSTLVELPLILFSNRFMDRFSGKALLQASFLIAGIQFLLYALSPLAWLTIAAMILLKAVASTLFMMIILKIVRNLVDPSLTTTGIAVVNAANNIGSIVLQNIAGSLTDRTDVPTLYLVMTAITAAGFLLCIPLRVGNREKVFG